MIWCGCCFKSRDNQVELDGMGQTLCSKGPPLDEQNTQCKGESESTGHQNVQYAMNVGTSVKCEDSSQDEREEEGKKLKGGTAHSATQHTPTESNLEAKEPDNGLPIKLTPSTPSVVESCADAPTAGCSGNRDSPSPPPAPLAVPIHVMSQVSEHSLTRSSVSGGGAASGSGSDQQLVSQLKHQADSSDRHQWQSDGTPPPASPGEDGSRAQTSDDLSNRATADEKEEEGGGGSHMKDKAPPQGCGTVEGKTEESTGLLHEREATGPNGSDVEPLIGTAPDTASPGEELGEGLDSNKQQQGEAGHQGRWPGTAQRVQTGSGSDQQLVSPMKPQEDSNDRHQWQADGTPPPASPGEDGSHAQTPDDLSNRATADEKEEEGGGGSHLKDKAPPQGCGTLEGRTEEPSGLLHEREATVQTPPRSGAEDLPTPVKCVACETQLSAEEIQHRKEQGEAPLCDNCRSALLNYLQDGSEGQGLSDQASEDTRPSPEVVPEGTMCKLPGCPKQAQGKGKYNEFCSKGHYQMYDMMTASPVPLKQSTSQRSPTSPTAPSHSGEGLGCQYPECSEVRAVDGRGRLLACCDVHHEEEESQLRQFQEGSGGQRGDSGQRGDNGHQRGNGASQSSDNGGQKGDSGGQEGDSGGQRGDSGGQSSDIGGQRGDSGGQKSDIGGQKGDSGGQGSDSGGQKGDSGGQKGDSGGQRGDSGGHQKGDSGGQRGDSGGQKGDSGGQRGDSGGHQKGDSGGHRGDSGCWEGHGGYQTAGSGGQRNQHNAQGNYRAPGRRDRSSRGGGHIPQPHPPAPRPKMCQYPGCQRPCYVEGDGRVHDFCGRTHADQYRAEQTRSGRAALSHHTEDESQGVLGWMAGKVSAFWVSSSHSTSGSHGNPGKGGSSAIKFYHKHEPYYEFTNFYQATLQIAGKVWATSENYFQAQKYIGTPLYDAIQQSQTAREAFDISRTPGLGLQWRRNDWEAVKEDVMYVALYAKFTQHEQLTKMLLDTGDHKLVEHTSRDSYWGDGGDGRGQNRLGKLLMKLRGELRKEMEAVLGPVSQGGRKRRNEGSGEGVHSRAKKVSSDASDTGSSVD